MQNLLEEFRRRQSDDYGPVELVYADNPLQVVPGRRLAMIQVERYETNADALNRAVELSKTEHFHNPYIWDEDEHIIFAGHELMSRCS